jgi:hypothetical protein
MTTATTQNNALDTSYNGWATFETWEVALWLQNDEGLYNLAMECGSYEDTVEALNEMGLCETPDGTRYDDPAVNVVQLDSEVFGI